MKQNDHDDGKRRPRCQTGRPFFFAHSTVITYTAYML